MKRMLFGLFTAMFAASILLSATGNAIHGTTCPGAGCDVSKIDGLGTISIQVTGSFSGTIAFEKSNDNVTYTSLTLSGSTSTTAAGFFSGASTGAKYVRARFTSYTSGTPTVTWSGVQAAPGGTTCASVGSGDVLVGDGSSGCTGDNSVKVPVAGEILLNRGGDNVGGVFIQDSGSESIRILNSTSASAPVIKMRNGQTGGSTFNLFIQSGDNINSDSDARIYSAANLRLYSTSAASFLIRNSTDTANLFSVDGSGNVTAPTLKAPSGHHYFLCISDTGAITSQTTACAG